MPVLIVYFSVGTYYRYSERDCKRIVQMTQSPMYSHFSDTLNGVATIRCFGSKMQRRFERECRRLMLLRNGAFYYMTLVQQFGAMCKCAAA